MKLDLKTLNYFVQVVQAGSLSLAAQRCHISQPSLTAAMNRLEERLNQTLLYRERQGIRLTPAGDTLYQQALGLLAHAQQVESRFFPGQDQIEVQLGVANSVSLHYADRIIKLAQRLELPIRWHLTEQWHQAQWILAPNEGQAIGEEQYRLLLPKGHALAHRSTLAWDDLEGLNLVQRRFCEQSELFDQMMVAHQLSPKVVATVDTEEWALQLTAMGLGGCFMPIAPDFDHPSIQWISFEALHPPLHRFVGLKLNNICEGRTRGYFMQLCRHL